MYNVVVHGTEPDPSQPLMAVDHLQVGLTIDSLLNREMARARHHCGSPGCAHGREQSGENNLPKPEKKSTSSSNTNVFDLAIRELRLNNGEIYYNDQKTPLEADLHNFAVSANYDAAQENIPAILAITREKSCTESMRR